VVVKPTPLPVPYLLTLPNTIEGRSREDATLSQVRAWATRHIRHQANHTDRVLLRITDWDHVARDEDGRAAVACVAWVRGLPTVAGAAAEMRGNR
jgi:hypothetical protein